MLSGAETDEDIESYGQEKLSFLETFLELPNGIPSYNTVTRAFRYLDKDAFSNCLYKYSKDTSGFIDEQYISIDGKVCRVTNKGSKKKNGICIVTAWACEQNLCLGQLKTAEKSNEKTAIPALIDEIYVQKSVVSIDAIANSPSVAAQIIDKGGNYIFSLKKNQKTVFEQVSNYMQSNQSLLEVDGNIDLGSGRIENRTRYVVKDLIFIEGTLAWKGIKSVIMIHATREVRDEVQERKNTVFI